MLTYATLLAGLSLLVWGLLVKNTGGFTSGLLVKVYPTLLGLWCLFEVARTWL